MFLALSQKTIVSLEDFGRRGARGVRCGVETSKVVPSYGADVSNSLLHST